MIAPRRSKRENRYFVRSRLPKSTRDALLLPALGSPDILKALDLEQPII